MTKFLSGLQLSERLYTDIVRPVLDDYFPNVAHAASLIGWGSEVLEYDDAVSTDHNWGPRVQLFLSPADHDHSGEMILRKLDECMPPSLLGYPTNYEVRVPEHQRGLRTSSLLSEKHNVELLTVTDYFRSYLGYEPQAELDAVDWLQLSEHRLLTVTSGRVFHDGPGDLRRARKRFAYYPDAVWRYLLAVQWARLAEEEAFVGRSGDAGDELGSRLIAARQVRLMIRLSFLMERRYAPYRKWLGTAFSQLRSAGDLAPLFEKILNAEVWREREHALAAAYETLARMHNELLLTPPLPVAITSYHERPYKVLFAGRFAEALFATIQERALRRIPFHVGSVSQFVDSDVKEDPAFAARLRGVYERRETSA